MSGYAEGTGVGARVGTLGLGLELVHSINSSVNARVGWNGYTFHEGITESDVKYDADLQFSSVSALVDWHPLDNGFRVSGGVLFNGNKLAMKATPTSNVTIGDVSYTPAEVGTLNSKVTFDDLAPYLGIGWGNAVAGEKGLGFSADLGVVFQGSPNANLTASGGTLSTDPTFLTELKKEEAELNDGLSDFEYYPFVSVGITYKFD